jgi:hypothetical protein
MTAFTSFISTLDDSARWTTSDALVNVSFSGLIAPGAAAFFAKAFFAGAAEPAFFAALVTGFAAAFVDVFVAVLVQMEDVNGLESSNYTN